VRDGRATGDNVGITAWDGLRAERTRDNTLDALDVRVFALPQCDQRSRDLVHHLQIDASRLCGNVEQT
jgi:hypothetical protein